MVTIEAWLLSNAEDDVSWILLAGILCTSLSPNLTLLGVYMLYASIALEFSLFSHLNFGQ